MMSIDGFFILSRYIKTRSAHMYIYTHFFVACIYHIFALKQLLWIPQGPTNHFRAAAHLRHAATSTLRRVAQGYGAEFGMCSATWGILGLADIWIIPG